MTSAPSKISGNINAATGAIKQNIGAAIGNERMQVEGATTRAKGNTEVCHPLYHSKSSIRRPSSAIKLLTIHTQQYHAARTQGYAEGQADSIGGSIKKHVGALLGNE